MDAYDDVHGGSWSSRMREIARGMDPETRARSHLPSNHHVRRIARSRSTLFSLIV